MWHEIKVELEQENIRPVSPDVDNMMEITRILNDRAAGVSATQVCLREGRGGKRERNNDHVSLGPREVFAIGPLQDPVTWYGINYTGTQMTQWDF